MLLRTIGIISRGIIKQIFFVTLCVIGENWVLAALVFRWLSDSYWQQILLFSTDNKSYCFLLTTNPTVSYWQQILLLPTDNKSYCFLLTTNPIVSYWQQILLFPTDNKSYCYFADILILMTISRTNFCKQLIALILDPHKLLHKHWSTATIMSCTSAKQTCSLLLLYMVMLYYSFSFLSTRPPSNVYEMPVTHLLVISRQYMITVSEWQWI